VGSLCRSLHFWPPTIRPPKPTRAKRPPNWCLLIKPGETALEILPAAQEKQAGAVVLGTHGGSAASHAAGSTSEKVVQNANVPVIVMRYPRRCLPS